MRGMLYRDNAKELTGEVEFIEMSSNTYLRGDRLFCGSEHPMVISRNSWERLVELWDISEVASTISKALAALYMIKTGLHEPDIDVDVLIRNIEECKSILRRLLVDLDSYMDGKAPETELVTLLINAYGDTNVEKIRRSLGKAIQGLEKLVKATLRRPRDMSILEGKDKDVVELENLLKILSDTLSRKVERMASEIYAF